MKNPTLTATVYNKKGKILAVAQNSYTKTHPTQAKYAKMAGESYKEYLHAEVHALIKALKNGIPHKIKIERFDKSGKPKTAKPCPICLIAIEKAGIEIVEFTIG